MFSGKTSELIRLVDRKRISGKSCLIIKHVKDIRFDHLNGNNNITTHSQMSYKQCDVIHLHDLNQEFILDLISGQKYNVIAIEEGHFFTNLESSCSMLANNKIDVIVSALDSSFEQKLFTEVGNLIANAETTIKLNSVCMICKTANASFNIRTIDSSEQILVGGSDIYKSVCRKCLNEFKNEKMNSIQINDIRINNFSTKEIIDI